MTSLETIFLRRTSSFCTAYVLSFNTTKPIIGHFEEDLVLAFPAQLVMALYSKQNFNETLFTVVSRC